jgi:putative endonuclease
MNWHVYILHCADGSLYTGIATDVDRRLQEHNEHPRLAARYTRARRPVVLVYVEEVADRAAAARREYVIKQLSRQAKKTLIEQSSAASSDDGD